MVLLYNGVFRHYMNVANAINKFLMKYLDTPSFINKNELII